MNPVDHPHGGGEAHHTPGGHPVTPWGKPTLGYRTRKKGKQSDRYIVRGRRRGKKKGGQLMGRSTKKGPWVEERLMGADRRDERGRQKTDGQNLVADLDDLPGDGRPHDRRPRRQKTRPGLHLRVDGRAQARRVRADPHLPLPLRHGKGD